jgi:hypothetical protein
MLALPHGQRQNRRVRRLVAGSAADRLHNTSFLRLTMRIARQRTEIRAAKKLRRHLEFIKA